MTNTEQVQCPICGRTCAAGCQICNTCYDDVCEYEELYQDLGGEG